MNRAFVACVQAAAGIIRRPLPGTRWGRAMKGRHLLEEFLGRHVAAKRAAGGDDLFSVLCALRDDDGEGLSDRDIVNHMIFLLMAAHDTSTITVTTIMRQLGATRSGEPGCATRPRTSRTARPSTSSTRWSPSTWS